jgi:hypothetical protein
MRPPPIVPFLPRPMLTGPSPRSPWERLSALAGYPSRSPGLGGVACETRRLSWPVSLFGSRSRRITGNWSNVAPATNCILAETRARSMRRGPSSNHTECEGPFG